MLRCNRLIMRSFENVWLVTGSYHYIPRSRARMLITTREWCLKMIMRNFITSDAKNDEKFIASRAPLY